MGVPRLSGWWPYYSAQSSSRPNYSIIFVSLSVVFICEAANVAFNIAVLSEAPTEGARCLGAVINAAAVVLWNFCLFAAFVAGA